MTFKGLVFTVLWPWCWRLACVCVWMCVVHACARTGAHAVHVGVCVQDCPWTLPAFVRERVHTTAQVGWVGLLCLQAIPQMLSRSPWGFQQLE